MTECFLSDERLSAYADGTLAEPERAGVETHLAGCARCAGQLAWLRTLATQTEALPRALVPARDLWSGIATRLGEPTVVPIAARRRIVLRPLTLAAAAVALIVLSAAATMLLLRREPASTATHVTAPGVIPAGADPQAMALARLVAQVRELEKSLPPGTRALVADNLKLIDAAITESEQALAGTPGNAAVERMLEARYQQRLELLEQARRAAPES
jgi:anti-sigma factor RsiW